MSDQTDPTAVAAIIAAAGTAIGTVANAIKGSRDGKDVTARLDAIDAPKGALAMLAHRVEEIASLVDTKLRTDLDSLAERYRKDREGRRSSLAQSGSYQPPTVDAGARIDALERRIAAAEERALREREEAAEAGKQLDKLTAWFEDARVMIARIETHLDHLIRRATGGNGSSR